MGPSFRSRRTVTGNVTTAILRFDRCDASDAARRDTSLRSGVLRSGPFIPEKTRPHRPRSRDERCTTKVRHQKGTIMSRSRIVLSGLAITVAAAGAAHAFCGFLCRGLGYQDVRRCDPGRTDARWHAHRAVDAERLPRASRGLCDGRAGASRAQGRRRKGPPEGGLRSARLARLAAACRVLGARPMSAAAAAAAGLQRVLEAIDGV